MSNSSRRAAQPNGRCVRAALCIAALGAATTAAADSMQFFGTGTGGRDRITVQLPAAADVGGTFTIEFQVRAAPGFNTNGETHCGATGSYTKAHLLIDKDLWNQAGGEYSIGVNDQTLVAGFGFDDGAHFAVCGGLSEGTWHHVAVQRSQSGLIELYIDGRLVDSGNGPSGNLSYPGGSPSRPHNDELTFGAEHHDANPDRYPSFAGLFDELRISSGRRYSGNFTPPRQPFSVDATTAALYHFDEGSGADVFDVRGLSNGQLASPARWSTSSPFGGAPANGTIVFVSPDISVTESATASLQASRVGGSAGRLSVTYQTNGGTASQGIDYYATSGELVWQDGETQPQQIAVISIDDSQTECPETFNVDLSNGERATVTIDDNDLMMCQ